MNSKGFSPATSGNYSIREGESSLLVSASGIDKGKIREENFIKMNFDGSFRDTDHKPSDESLLHAKLYELSSEIHCILHSHSVPVTVLSMATEGNELRLEGLEMQKALTGTKTHELPIRIKIIDNHQDMNVLRERLETVWNFSKGLDYAFILRGHGLYAWGKSISEAKKHVEGLEFLFSCQLELKRMGLR
jgi:methylthioribulose-1-phosphate dehydratase